MPKNFFGYICKNRLSVWGSTHRPLWLQASGDPLQARVCYFFILLQLFIRP